MKGKVLFIIIALLIAAFAGYLLRVAFVGDPLETWSGVQDLHLTQEGLDVTANWSEMDNCDSYNVTILHDGRLTMIPGVKENMYTATGFYPGERCVVMVRGNLKKGFVSRGAREVLIAEKVGQNITVGDTSYYGFAGNDFNLKASANGDLHYKSSDRSIARVDGKGKVTLKESGEAVITINADGNGLFEDAERDIDVFIYPTVLDKIEGTKVENISPTRAIMKWKENSFAAAYTVLRKNPATEEYEVLTELPAGVNYLEVTRSDYDYEIKGVAEVNGEKVDGKVSDPLKVRGTTQEAASYPGYKTVRKLDMSFFNVIAEHHGKPKVKIPQSLNVIGDTYVVTTDMKNTDPEAGDIIAFSKSDGSITATAKTTGIGHGNAAAYNPNTNRLYVLSEKKGKSNQWCTVYDGETFKFIDKIVMPVACTSIAYDISTDKFYLAKENKAYVCNSNFRVEKTFTKAAPFYHTQDSGGYNGAMLGCTFPGGKESYIDFYRASDGAYLGSYDVSFGEVEACAVDDGYLVILLNTRANDDKILRSKQRISIP